MDRTTRIVVGVVAAALVLVIVVALVIRAGDGSDANDADGATGPVATSRGSTAPPGTSTTTGTTPATETTPPDPSAPPVGPTGPTTSAPTGAGNPTGGAAPSNPAPPPSSATRSRLGSVSTWSFALGVDLDGPPAATATQLAGYDLVVIDGAEADPALIAALHARGAIVLGYLSVGTVERNRSWTAAAEPYLLDHWSEWDETYADTGQAGFRDLIVDTVTPPILDKGFDGLFLDNTDMVDTHPAQQPGMVDLVGRLSDAVHRRGGVLFAQNGDSTVDAIAGFLDGWNREDLSSTYDAEGGSYAPRPSTERDAGVATIERLRNRGLLVTAVDYTSAADGPDVDAARRTACAAGAVPYVSDIGLSRIPGTPPRCG